MYENPGRFVLPARGMSGVARKRSVLKVLAVAAVALGPGLLTACTADKAGARPDHGVSGFYGAIGGGWSR